MPRDRETYRGFIRNIRFGRPRFGNHTPQRRREIWRLYREMVTARNRAKGAPSMEGRMELMNFASILEQLNAARKDHTDERARAAVEGAPGQRDTRAEHGLHDLAG